MRRIIERVVTVVTTTTWKISWEKDTSQADPQPDPVPEAGILSETAQRTQTDPSVIEIKEAELTQEENAPDPKADEPSIESHPAKTERKSKS